MSYITNATPFLRSSTPRHKPAGPAPTMAIDGVPVIVSLDNDFKSRVPDRLIVYKAFLLDDCMVG